MENSEETAIELVASFENNDNTLEEDESGSFHADATYFSAARGNYSLVQSNHHNNNNINENLQYLYDRHRQTRRRRRVCFLFLALLAVAWVVLWQSPVGNSFFPKSNLLWWNHQQNSTSSSESGANNDHNNNDHNNNNNVTQPSGQISEMFACGCVDCTQTAFHSNADDSTTCQDRVAWLQSRLPLLYPTQVDACRQVALEYPCTCGARCDPARCRVPLSEPEPDVQLPPKATTVLPPLSTEPDPLVEANVYCFPPSVNRTQYNLWGEYVVQVKQSSVPGGVCGPGDNMFDASAVQVDASTNVVTLKYKVNQSHPSGIASEVRVVPRWANQSFGYGTYRFSVKTLRVTHTNGTTSLDMPPELTLGLFTWDDSEEFATHEQYNHEVDIEIGKWGCDTNADVQFLTQPPGYPHMHRFFSGTAAASNNDTATDTNAASTNSTRAITSSSSSSSWYHPYGHSYQFTWLPGRIDWNTTAGGGVNFSLTTAKAVQVQNTTDSIQCASSSSHLEVRLNLWYTQLETTTQLSDPTITEVLVEIDQFSYTPSPYQDYLPNGQVCSKDCQCEPQVSSCVDHQCQPIDSQP